MVIGMVVEGVVFLVKKLGAFVFNFKNIGWILNYLGKMELRKGSQSSYDSSCHFSPLLHLNVE